MADRLAYFRVLASTNISLNDFDLLRKISWDDEIAVEPYWCVTLVVTKVFKCNEFGDCFIMRGLNAKGWPNFLGCGHVPVVGTVIYMPNRFSISKCHKTETNLYVMDYDDSCEELGQISNIAYLSLEY